MKTSALDVQTGGDHYKKMKFQPVFFAFVMGLSFNEGNVVKYTTRHASKNGKEDLEKVLHYLDFIWEFEIEDQGKISLFLRKLKMMGREILFKKIFYQFASENNLDFDQRNAIWHCIFSVYPSQIKLAKRHIQGLIDLKYGA